MKILLFLILSPLTLLAQKMEPLPKELAGVWTGFMYNDTTAQKNDFELVISENGRRLKGYSYTIFLIDGKKNIGVKRVKVQAGKELLLIEDEKLIDDNYDDRPAKGVRTFIELHYSTNGTTETLSGPWKTNITREYNSVTGNIFLVRKKQPEETAIIPKLRQLNLLDELSFLPPEGLVSVKNKDIIAKSADGVKNEKQATDTEKIIPDTTITNEEITIFMFPKNDARIKDSVSAVEENNTKVARKENPVVKTDKPASNQIKNQTEQRTQVMSSEKADHSNAIQEAIEEAVTAKSNLHSGEKQIQKSGLTRQIENDEIAVLDSVSTNTLEKKAEGRKIEKSAVKKEVLFDENTKNETRLLEPAPAKDKKIVLNPPASRLITGEMLRAREIETIRTVEIAKDTLIFSLFDNGVIDGDTVSVLLNGEVIMSKIELLSRAYNDTIYLTPEMGDSIHIILYAENLGSIAPNTGLLVVREGGVNHEIRFSGDLKKNSAVILKRKKQINGQ